jgi:hypothetical protein
MSVLQSIQPRHAKIVDPVLINVRADEKALEAVVAVMHIFGEPESNSPNANAKTSAKKAKVGSK